MMNTSEIKDKHGVLIDEGQILTRDRYSWFYKVLATDAGKLMIWGLGNRYGGDLESFDMNGIEVIGTLNERHKK